VQLDRRGCLLFSSYLGGSGDDDNAATASAASRPGETRSPGAGEDLSPTSRQEARTVADHTRDPHPSRHLPTHPTRKEDQPPTGPPPRPTSQHQPSPEEGTAMPDTHVTITGNLTDDPEVSFTPK
jgi:hypothetical protein